jgi:hypothetical protein
MPQFCAAAHCHQCAHTHTSTRSCRRHRHACCVSVDALRKRRCLRRCRASTSTFLFTRRIATNNDEAISRFNSSCKRANMFVFRAVWRSLWRLLLFVSKRHAVVCDGIRRLLSRVGWHFSVSGSQQSRRTFLLVGQQWNRLHELVF